MSLNILTKITQQNEWGLAITDRADKGGGGEMMTMADEGGGGFGK